MDSKMLGCCSETARLFP